MAFLPFANLRSISVQCRVVTGNLAVQKDGFAAIIEKESVTYMTKPQNLAPKMIRSINFVEIFKFRNCIIRQEKQTASYLVPTSTCRMLGGWLILEKLIKQA